MGTPMKLCVSLIFPITLFSCLKNLNRPGTIFFTAKPRRVLDRMDRMDRIVFFVKLLQIDQRER